MQKVLPSVNAKQEIIGTVWPKHVTAKFGLHYVSYTSLYIPTH
jgi:hypothetical protein